MSIPDIESSNVVIGRCHFNPPSNPYSETITAFLPPSELHPLRPNLPPPDAYIGTSKVAFYKFDTMALLQQSQMVTFGRMPLFCRAWHFVDRTDAEGSRKPSPRLPKGAQADNVVDAVLSQMVGLDQALISLFWGIWCSWVFNHNHRKRIKVTDTKTDKRILGLEFGLALSDVKN